MGKKKVTQKVEKSSTEYVVMCGCQPIFSSESLELCQEQKKLKEAELLRGGADIHNAEHQVTIT